MTSAPAYPGFGSPCNGCGQCCIISPCRLARNYAGVREGPCPVLVREGDAWTVSLDPVNKLGKTLGQQLGVY